MVLAAAKYAHNKATEAQQKLTSNLTGGMNLPKMPGLFSAMSDIAPPVAALIEEFSKLPGVGVKTAQRLTFFILRSPTDQARRLAEAIMRVKESIIYCSRCFNITETDPCSTCSNPSRDQEVICVVEEPLDMLALEKTGVYKGLYHVLHGALSPVEGIGPKDLRIDELI